LSAKLTQVWLETMAWCISMVVVRRRYEAPRSVSLYRSSSVTPQEFSSFWRPRSRLSTSTCFGATNVGTL
jgi:hypothetical protein